MIEIARTRGEAVLFDFKLLHDRDEQIRKRQSVTSVPFKAMMLSMTEATTRKHDGEVSA